MGSKLCSNYACSYFPCASDHAFSCNVWAVTYRVRLALIYEQRRMQRLSKSTKELDILMSDCNRIR